MNLSILLGSFQDYLFLVEERSTYFILLNFNSQAYNTYFLFEIFHEVSIFCNFSKQLFIANTKASLTLTLALKALFHRFFQQQLLKWKRTFCPNFKSIRLLIIKLLTSEFPQRTLHTLTILKWIESNFFNQSINREFLVSKLYRNYKQNNYYQEFNPRFTYHNKEFLLQGNGYTFTLRRERIHNSVVKYLDTYLEPR